MSMTIHIRLMGKFAIYIDGQEAPSLSKKSPKGVALVQYLIINRGQTIPNYRLLTALWNRENGANPENALKTLVSRMRSLLNGLMPGLGKCIVSERGAYHWRNLPGTTIDICEIEDLLDRIRRASLEQRRGLYEELLEAYTGDLLQDELQWKWMSPLATELHNRYVAAICDYADMLCGNDEKIIEICRRGLEAVRYDDRLHAAMMAAMLRTGDEEAYGSQEVLAEHDDAQILYGKIVEADSVMEDSMAAICADLKENKNRRGTFVCDYTTFKEICSVEMANMERNGTTLFIALISVVNYNALNLDEFDLQDAMVSLESILRTNLRRGDLVTRYSPNTFALMLPSVNYTTGSGVISRIRDCFENANPNIPFTLTYRLATTAG